MYLIEILLNKQASQTSSDKFHLAYSDMGNFQRSSKAFDYNIFKQVDLHELGANPLGFHEVNIPL